MPVGRSHHEDWTGLARLDDARQRRCLRDLHAQRRMAIHFGLREIECLRLVRRGHTEFKTVMRFDSMESVEEFAGPDVTKAVLTPRAIELLRRYDVRAEHFEIR